MPPSCSPDSSGIRQQKTTRTPSSPSRTRLLAKRWHASILLTIWLKAVVLSKPSIIQSRNSWTESTTTSSNSSSRATSGDMRRSESPSWIGSSASSVSISNRFRCQSPFRAFSSQEYLTLKIRNNENTRFHFKFS